MKKLGVAVLAAMLLLSGCAASGSQAVAEDSPVTAAPITSAPEASPAEESTSGDMDPDEFFLKGMAASWVGELPANDELLSAAKLACEKLANGEEIDTVAVVEGGDETAISNNNQLVHIAAQVYCPEYR